MLSQTNQTRIWVEVLKLTYWHLVGSNRVFLLFSGSQRFQFLFSGSQQQFFTGTYFQPKTHIYKRQSFATPASINFHIVPGTLVPGCTGTLLGTGTTGTVDHLALYVAPQGGTGVQEYLCCYDACLRYQPITWYQVPVVSGVHMSRNTNHSLPGSMQ